MRVPKKRDFYNPASSSTDVFMTTNVTPHHTSSGRRISKRKTFDPSTASSTTFTDELKNESVKNIQHTRSMIEMIKRQKVTHVDTTGDCYTKDNVRSECTDKHVCNRYIEEFALGLKNATCLVLDGKKARTTKRLLKTGVSDVIIPNNSKAVIPLRKFAKKHDNVTVIDGSLYDVVASTKQQFDIIYMDTCGVYKTGASDDLRNTIGMCFYRNLLKRNGLFGVTVTKRTNGTYKHAAARCRNRVEFVSGLECVFTHEYGNMVTMFFK